MKVINKIFKKQHLTQEDYNNIVKECYKHIINPTEAQKVEHENALKGGKCFYCEKKWVRKSLDTTIARYKYYVPDCECLEKLEKKRKLIALEKFVVKNSRIPAKYHNANIKNMDKDINPKTLKAIEKVTKYIQSGLYQTNGIVLYGDIGVGKTHLAVSILKAIAIKNKRTAIFVHTSDLINNIIKDRDNYLGKILEKEIVLLDDIDKGNVGNKTDSEWVAEKFFSLINGLTSNNKIIIGTSNLQSIDDFAKVYDNSIVSRLIEACIFVHIEGDDYRLKKRGMA